MAKVEPPKGCRNWLVQVLFFQQIQPRFGFKVSCLEALPGQFFF